MMKNWQKQCVILGVLGAITAVYLNGTRVLKSRIPGLTTGGYLMDTNYFAPTGSFNQFIFGVTTAASMSGFISLMSEYDMKKNYGLLDVHSDYGYMSRFSDMARQAWGSMQNHQMRTQGKKFGLAMQDVLGIQSLKNSKSPLLLAGVLAAVYSGKMLRYQLSSDFAMESQTNMNQSRLESQYVGWRSSAIDVSAGASYSADGQTAELNMRKQIVDGVSLNYGVSTQSQTVGVTYSKGF